MRVLLVIANCELFRAYSLQPVPFYSISRFFIKIAEDVFKLLYAFVAFRGLAEQAGQSFGHEECLYDADDIAF